MQTTQQEFTASAFASYARDQIKLAKSETEEDRNARLGVLKKATAVAKASFEGGSKTVTVDVVPAAQTEKTFTPSEAIGGTNSKQGGGFAADPAVAGDLNKSDKGTESDDDKDAASSEETLKAAEALAAGGGDEVKNGDDASGDDWPEDMASTKAPDADWGKDPGFSQA